MKTVVITSGGIDSTVLLHDVVVKGIGAIAVGIDYGQRHGRELLYASRQAYLLGVSFRRIDVSSLGTYLRSSQTTPEIAVPNGHYAEESMKQTVVPNRNAILLNIAIGIAISEGADSVAYAAHAGDHTIYPDCRPEFAEAMNRVAQICDWTPISLLAPFVQLTKADIVRRGAELGVDFSQTWSCYKAVSNWHCGVCGTCVERREAFGIAGVEDPTHYETATV